MIYNLPSTKGLTSGTILQWNGKWEEFIGRTMAMLKGMRILYAKIDVFGHIHRNNPKILHK